MVLVFLVYKGAVEKQMVEHNQIASKADNKRFLVKNHHIEVVVFMDTVVIREIEQGDNKEVAKVIRKVLVDLGVPKVGTAYADTALDHMYENYDVPRATYFVVEERGEILGCAGVAPLDNYEGNVCELQKMYFLEKVRGKGIGAKMMKVCLDKAKAYGFEKVYIETMPFMKAAQKLYVKSGFSYINARMGDTGHYSCPVWMLKTLD